MRRSVTDERNLATEDEVNKVIAKGIPKGKKRATEAGGASGKKKRKVSGKAGSGESQSNGGEMKLSEGSRNGYRRTDRVYSASRRREQQRRSARPAVHLHSVQVITALVVIR